MAIEIVLSSYNMGDNVDEVDFDLWARFVRAHVAEVLGVNVECVEQQRFGEGGDDVVVGGTQEERDAVRLWLSVDGWEAFCGVGGPWEQMRREHDAEAA